MFFGDLLNVRELALMVIEGAVLNALLFSVQIKFIKTSQPAGSLSPVFKARTIILVIQNFDTSGPAVKYTITRWLIELGRDVLQATTPAISLRVHLCSLSRLNNQSVFRG